MVFRSSFKSYCYSQHRKGMSTLCFLGLPKVLKAPCSPASASHLGWRGVETPHLVRVPARLFILVKKMFLSKLPAVAIKHRTDPAGQKQG